MDLGQQLAQFQAQLERIAQAGAVLNGSVSPPAAPVAQQSAAESQEYLLRLYAEFVKTDEGKQLAANLGRFARFAQSQVDRQKEKPA